MNDPFRLFYDQAEEPMKWHDDENPFTGAAAAYLTLALYILVGLLLFAAGVYLIVN